MDFVKTDQAPQPGGHYTQAIAHNGFLFVSGQLPIDPGTGKPVAGSIEQQTTRALENVLAILRSAGSCRELVLKTTVYISDIQLWSRVNAAYARFFGEHRPARAVVPTRELHHGCLVEIEAVAALEDPTAEVHP